jgi:hypothetical protein
VGTDTTQRSARRSPLFDRALAPAAAVVAVLAVVLGVAWSTSARSTVTPRTDAVTPLLTSEVLCGPGGADRYGDVAGSVHEANVECASGLGLVVGTSATTFDPVAGLSRGQAASLLVNVVQRATGSRRAARRPVGHFADTVGNVHDQNIRLAVDRGIMQGYADGTFAPDEPITREQLATAATRATDVALGACCPPDSVPLLAGDGVDDFDDDDESVHQGSIEKAVDRSLLEGTGDRLFSPDAGVTRGQAATVVVRAVVNVLHPAERWKGGSVPTALD